jgi:PPOX class probable F420-dependent enzyme
VTLEQVAFLDAQRVGHLGTVDSAGRPHVLPVCYVCLGGRVYTPIDEKPKRGEQIAMRRVRNVLAQPSVCLTVDRYDEDWTRLAWLQVRGLAALVHDPDERRVAIAALRARYPQYRDMALEERLLIGVIPDRVVEWRYQ